MLTIQEQAMHGQYEDSMMLIATDVAMQMPYLEDWTAGVAHAQLACRAQLQAATASVPPASASIPSSARSQARFSKLTKMSLAVLTMAGFLRG